MKLHSFVFSPFYENTYIIWDETNAAAIIDPGCYTATEEQALAGFIKQHKLTPTRLLNTHCHLDHIFGNAFVAKEYGLLPECHELELPIMEQMPRWAEAFYGLRAAPSPIPQQLITAGSVIKFGNTTLETYFTPGHSPGSVSFFNRESQTLISGDVLFEDSIGRTDLPGGSFEVLMHSIITQLLPLGDAVAVHSGHGNVTSIGRERSHNPFVLEALAQKR